MGNVSTSIDKTDGLLGHPSTVCIVGALAFALFSITNLPWQLDDYDQAKQAFTSFEMVKEGHWLYQRTPHDRVATKPPLVGWISAGVFEVTRSWNLAWRLPSLGAAIALSILLFRSAKNAYGGAGGLIAASAFGFNLLTPRLASLVRTDMPLALVVFLIGLQIWRHLREQRTWNTRDQLWMFGLLAAAMLIKGPIVYAFLLPGIVSLVALRRRGGRSHGWPGWWPWLASLSIFLAWVIGGSIFVPNFYDQVVMREFLGRFGETVHRPQPFYFYVPHLLHKFAPWSVLMIVLAIVDLQLVRFNRTSWKKWLVEPGMKPETLWLIGWAIGGLLVMSLIPSKRVDRIFPIVPPLCLLLAAQLSNVSELRERRYRWTVFAVIFSILFAGAYSGFKVFTGYRDHRDGLVKFGHVVREKAEGQHWRYEIVNASDEGLLLYLQKLHFVKRDNALTQWNSGNVDALVASAKDSSELLPDLANAYVAEKDRDGRYVLIRR